MTGSALLDSVVDRLEDVVERVQVLSQRLDDHNINAKPDPKKLSIAQIFEHMILGAQHYTRNTRAALENAVREGVDREVHQTWFGKMVTKASGPKSNAPMPKQLVPGPGPYRKEVVDRWMKLHQELIELAKSAHGYDLSEIPMRSPIIKLFKMNLADVFEILAAHAERHVVQIEQIARTLRQAKEPAAAGS